MSDRPRISGQRFWFSAMQRRAEDMEIPGEELSPDPERACGSCRFWARESNPRVAWYDPCPGTCKRRAPVGGDQPYPRMHELNGCGEHEGPRIAADNQLTPAQVSIVAALYPDAAKCNNVFAVFGTTIKRISSHPFPPSWIDTLPDQAE